jgi:hypothetical protein
MKLRRNQDCPIHRSLSCCGREVVQKERRIRRLGVQRIEDPHHPGISRTALQSRDAEAT